MKDILINDFNNLDFQNMFKSYFSAMGVNVSNWKRLFKAMNDENRNFAYILYDEDESPIGFIQFTAITLSSGFFETKMGFIREFWISGKFRNLGHGSELLRLAEEFFINNEIRKSILTTNTAEKFYIRHGYVKDADITAKNGYNVFVKILR